jgi:hypothetical protein
MSIEWNEQLTDQLDWHWQHHLRPRLAGLTDEEYFWEPVPGCWSVRWREEASPELARGAGKFVAEFARPEPVPPPPTTIAWRLAHLIVPVFGSAGRSSPPTRSSPAG